SSDGGATLAASGRLAPRRADQSRPRRAGRRVSAGLRCYRLPQRLPAAATTGPGGCRQPAVLCGLGRCRRLPLCRTPATSRLGGACAARSRALPGRLAAHRLENAPAQLRQRITSLHTGGGLLPSWLLFVVIFTGPLACFDKELEHWMRPSLHGSSGPASASAQQISDWLAD